MLMYSLLISKAAIFVLPSRHPYYIGTHMGGTRIPSSGNDGTDAIIQTWVGFVSRGWCVKIGVKNTASQTWIDISLNFGDPRLRSSHFWGCSAGLLLRIVLGHILLSSLNGLSAGIESATAGQKRCPGSQLYCFHEDILLDYIADQDQVPTRPSCH